MAGAQSHAISLPVVILAIANAVLFALGALLHVGLRVMPIDEPVAIPVTVLEALGGLLLALAAIGSFTSAAWSRRVARFANTFAIVVVLAVAMLLALDGERSAAPIKTMQVLRVVFASVSLLFLYHSGPPAPTR
jgi:hypothetical protein